MKEKNESLEKTKFLIVKYDNLEENRNLKIFFLILKIFGPLIISSNDELHIILKNSARIRVFSTVEQQSERYLNFNCLISISYT